MEDAVLICKLCSKVCAKYTCPRCNVRYCSSDCYRSALHRECSELFYRNCIMESLGEMDADVSEKKKMVEMLKKFEEEESLDVDQSDENDGVPDLAERISGLDLDQNPEKVVEALLPEELKEFEALLNDKQRKTDLIELWKPWWSENSKPLLEEILNKGGPPSHVPSLIKGIQDIDKLLKKKKVPTAIAFDVINTLYGYAYVARLYNGDYLSLPVECAQSVITLSTSLQQMRFTDVESAINSCISIPSTRDQTLFVSSQYSIAVIEDVLKILTGPNTLNLQLYVMAALSECHRLFQTAHRTLKNERKKGSEHVNQIHLFYSVQKKLEFYLSWVKSCGSALEKHVPLVDLELCALSSDLSQLETEKGAVEELLDRQKARQARTLIEEL